MLEVYYRTTEDKWEDSCKTNKEIITKELIVSLLYTARTTTFIKEYKIL